MERNVNLKPCPFCGRDNPQCYHDTNSDYRCHWSFSVECECGASGASSKSEEQAIINWNSRLPKLKIDAWVTPLRWGSRVTFYKPPKPENWDNDEEEWFCYPLYKLLDKEQE